MEHRMRAFTLAFLLFGLCASLLSMVGCSTILDPGPAPTRVQLSPAMPAKFTGQPHKKQLVVALPMAGRDIDTDGIALLFHGREVRYLSGMRWTGTVPSLVQRNLLEALEYSGGLRGVADEGAGIAANAKLLCDIKQFSLRYDKEDSVPTAEFEASFRLVDLSNGSVVAGKTAQVTSQAADRETPALMQAFENVLGQALADVTPWVLENMKQVR